MSETFKTCPFCGSQPRIKMSIYLDTLPTPHFDIACYECNMVETKEGYCSVENAIEAWNKRS